MSKFIDFNAKLESDAALKADYVAVLKSNGVTAGTAYATLNDKTIADLIPVAKKAGIDFTVAEVKEYFAKGSADELSEDELEGVAGGKNDTITRPVNCDIGSGNIDVTVTL